MSIEQKQNRKGSQIEEQVEKTLYKTFKGYNLAKNSTNKVELSLFKTKVANGGGIDKQGDEGELRFVQRSGGNPRSSIETIRIGLDK